MTRDEALKAVAIGSSCIVWSLPNERPEQTQARMIEEHKQFVRRLEMLGLLKLAEKPSIKDRARDAILELDVDRRRSSNEIIAALEAAGLKIVEA